MIYMIKGLTGLQTSALADFIPRGYLESRILSSLRGRSPKQSGNYQPFPDCFISFAMTGQGFRYSPGMSVENIPYPVWNPVRDGMSVENKSFSRKNPVRDDMSVEDGMSVENIPYPVRNPVGDDMSVEDVTPSTEFTELTKSRFGQNGK